MPTNSDANAPKEFLIVTLPDDAKTGSNLRLIGVQGTLNAAEKAVAKLDPGILGRVAILERRTLYIRRPAVESSAVNDEILKN